jgi:hypothetical protein
MTKIARAGGSGLRRQRVPSVLSQAGTPIKDATMRKIVAGLAISLGDVAQSPAEWRFRHRNQRTARVSHA